MSTSTPPTTGARATGLLATVIAATLCTMPARGAESPGDYMDLAETTGYIPTLGKALAAAGLADALRGPARFTLFAPTEAAFARLPPGVLDDLLEPANRDRLRRLLLGFVVVGDVPRDSLGSVGQLRNLQGDTIELTNGPTGLAANGARVLAEIETRNGVIHMTDTVVLPPG